MNGSLADMGLVGLGVMGRNLALNLADHGVAVAGFDRWPEALERFAVAPRASGVSAPACRDLAELVAACRRPRAILLLVPAGAAVDETLDQVVPILDPGDIVIDGGNSFYKDTRRRCLRLGERGLHYVGLGVSGGEEGARRGPSLMAGGSAEALARLAPMLDRIAARAADRSCFAHVGPDGAGHFVKTLHNGIEYAAMQLLAEAYFIARGGLGLDQARIHDAFAGWRHGDLSSFLLDVTVDVLANIDEETGRPMLDLIVDRASQKGTGQWSANAALEYGVAAPTIAEAVHARCLSGARGLRAAGHLALGPAPDLDPADAAVTLGALHDALLAASLAAYAQGFEVIRAASLEHRWDVPFQRLAQIWQGGCIVRARLLTWLESAFALKPDLENVLLDPGIAMRIRAAEPGLRHIVCMAAERGLPAPAFASALAYLDGLRRDRIWANMIEAQRDYFGAHGFERLDRAGKFHRDWKKSP